MIIDRTLIDQLIQFSYKAGEAILEEYASLDVDIRRKSDNSPITIADERANKIICDGLRAIDESTPIISEENSIEPYEVRKKYAHFWLVDPLDGTKEFINYTGEFTTNIALISDCESIVGVIYAPVSGTLYWAVKGMGAYKIIDGKEEAIQVSTFDPNKDQLRIAVSRSHPCADTKKYIAAYDTPTLVTLGSSLKMMKIAEGKVDIYPRLVSLSEWDIAAGVCIVEESGGRVYGRENGVSLTFNTEMLRTPHFICEGKRIVDESKK